MNFRKELILQSKFEEVEKIEHLLNDLQSALNFNDELYAKLMLTVSEAVTNGIVHGNKMDESKVIKLLAESDGSILTIVTLDEGNGFDPKNVADPLADENLLKTGGRGVFLMGEYADSIEYSDNGRKLTMKFSLN